MSHWRVTRTRPYTNSNCPGHTSKSARQGHYTDAETADEAREIVHRRLELGEDEPPSSLDVQPWDR